MTAEEKGGSQRKREARKAAASDLLTARLASCTSPAVAGGPEHHRFLHPPVCDSSPLRPPLLPPRFPFSCLPALSCLIASGAHVPGRRGSPALPNYNQRWLPPPGVGSNTPHGQEQSPSLAPQSLASPTGHWDSEEGFHPWTAASGLLRHSIISERAKLHNPP